MFGGDCKGNPRVHTLTALELKLDLHTALRLALLYAHLLACVLALHTVLRTDWRLLNSRINARQLMHAHRRVVWVLGALWLSGGAIVALDGLAQLQTNPKLIAKIVCVSLLTLNGVVLRVWCLPRLVSDGPLSRAEACVLMACGAMSTTCWLMAGFYGIARPLMNWTVQENLLLLGAALAVALPVALSMQGRLRDGRRARLRALRRPLQTAPGELSADAGANPAGSEALRT